ncbi:glycosyltransferase family A protein [Mucilaginibacter sp. McL0603]|uniref:glycosyltransferase family A protein n=1 Tax=Mucilaginibacter sp. McL0603 TaxID=3415670 RepID=UPI003CF5A242
MTKLISLIIPTYGRDNEVKELLSSLEKQTCDKNDFEIIIVDQNDKINLSPIVTSFSGSLNIIHHKSSDKGIAKAKNKGIKLAKAPIITFPDDDCMYYPDTIANALNYLNDHPQIDILYGRLYDRKTQKNIMRNWPQRNKEVNIFNFHYTYSAVTAFIRRNNIMFDINFGVGSSYGIGEELDYLLQTFERKLTSFYTPSVDIWHPELNPAIMSTEKVYYYAKGFGAICRKHISFIMLYTFCMSNAFQILQIVKYIIVFNRMLAYKRWLGLKGRIVGFISFKKM